MARTTRPVPTRPVHTALTGSAMGLAELVPGFSAGTVAYVAGIYPKFLALLQAALNLPVGIVQGHAKQAFRAVNWRFGVTLATAMFATVFILAAPVRHLIDTQPVFMSALFFGLVCGAVVAAVTQLATVTVKDSILVLAGGAAVFAVLGLGQADTTNPPLWLMFVAGIIAISAWILPGISGSFMLVVLGVYPVVVGAAADRDVAVLAVFAAGCVLGIALIVNALTRLFRARERQVRLVLIAVMLGSARVLWPFSTAFAGTDLGLPDSAFDAVTALVIVVVAAAAVVWVAARTPHDHPA